MNAPQAERQVLFEVCEPVALLMLNQPDALNSFTRAMHHDL